MEVEKIDRGDDQWSLCGSALTRKLTGTNQHWETGKKDKVSKQPVVNMVCISFNAQELQKHTFQTTASQ